MEFRVRFSSKVHDLALLVPVDCPSCLDEISGFEVRTKAQIKIGQHVQLIGFPRLNSTINCGDNALVSNGVISRLRDINYNNVETNVVCQLIAATDFGSSGSPVLCSETKLFVGVASYQLETGRTHDVRDSCYMIPLGVINHFLETFSRSVRETENSKSLCDLGIVTSLSHSPILRNFYLGATSLDHGVLISKSDIPEVTTGDFMMSVNNRNINKSGMIWDDDLCGYVPYWYVIKMTHPGEKLHMQLVRNKEMIDVYVYPPQKHIQIDDGKYVQFGPMIFTQPLHYFGNVVISEFTHNTNMRGYELQNGIAILKINDKKVKNIANLKKRLSRFINASNQKNELIKMEFDNGDIVITPADVQMTSNF